MTSNENYLNLSNFFLFYIRQWAYLVTYYINICGLWNIQNRCIPDIIIEINVMHKPLSNNYQNIKKDLKQFKFYYKISK